MRDYVALQVAEYFAERDLRPVVLTQPDHHQRARVHAAPLRGTLLPLCRDPRKAQHSSVRRALEADLVSPLCRKCVGAYIHQVCSPTSERSLP